MWHKHKVKIIEMQNCDNAAADTSPNAPKPGTIAYIRRENSLHVRCVDGSYVKILKLQLEGKKVFTARDFNNGYLKKANANERYFDWWAAHDGVEQCNKTNKLI